MEYIFKSKNFKESARNPINKNLLLLEIFSFNFRHKYHLTKVNSSGTLDTGTSDTGTSDTSKIASMTIGVLSVIITEGVSLEACK